MKISYDINTLDLTLAHLPLQEIKVEVAFSNAFSTFTHNTMQTMVANLC